VGPGPAPMPFLTPRPDRRQRELRWADGGSQSSVRHSGVGASAIGAVGGGGDRDREVNVQVVLRCRSVARDRFPFRLPTGVSDWEYIKQIDCCFCSTPRVPVHVSEDSYW
jgi:kinesin family member 11